MLTTCSFCELSFDSEDSIYCSRQCRDDDLYRHSHTSQKRASINYLQNGVYLDPAQKEADPVETPQYHDYSLGTIMASPTNIPPKDFASEMFSGYSGFSK